MGGSASKAEVITYEKPKLVTLDAALSVSPGPVTVGNIVLSSSKQLQQIVAITIALANASDGILGAINSMSGKNPYLDAILAIPMDKGPEDIKRQVTSILTNLVNSGNLSQFDNICLSLRGILPILAPVFGDWVGNLSGQSNLNDILKELIELGAHESFDLVQNFYYLTKDAEQGDLQKTMASRESIERFMNDALGTIRKIINTYGGFQGEGDIATQAVTTIYGYLGQIILSKIIEEQFRPSIKPASQVLAKVIPLTFAVLSINEFCTQRGKLNNLGPIAVSTETTATPIATTETTASTAPTEPTEPTETTQVTAETL